MAVIAAFYFADFLTMHVLPTFVGWETAMENMAQMHKNVLWFIVLFGTTSMVFGFMVVNGRLVSVLTKSEESERTLAGELGARKRVEESLRESEERFRAVVDNSPTKIHIKDLDGRYTLINRQSEILFGVTNEEARGKTSRDIFSKEVADSFAGHDQAVIESGETIEEEEEWVREDGVHTYLTVKFPILGATGEIAAVGAIGTDITERKRAEEALRRSENRLRGALESLQEGFMLLDAEDRVVAINDVYREINPQAQEFLDKGMRVEDLIRANVAKGRVMEALGREEEFMRERLEQHRNPGPPMLRQYNDGKWYIIRETRTPEGGIAITFSDVTELQTAKEAREKLSKAVENVPVGIALFDSDDRLVFFNNRYAEFMEVMADILKPGVTFEEMIRTIVHRQPVKDARGREEAFLRERIKHHRNPTGPFDIRRENRWLQANENRMPDGGTFVIVSDITEHMRAEEALRESEERFRHIYENTPVMLHSIGKDGRLLSVSDYWLKVLGYERDEVLGQKAVKFMTKECARHVTTTTLPEFIMTGRYTDLPLQFVKKNGEVIDVLLSAVAERDEGGEFVRSLTVLIDVTERKLAEEALRESEARLKDIAGAASDWFWEMDEHLRYTMFSRRRRETIGIASKESIGKTRWQVAGVNPDEEEKWRDHRAMLEAHEAFRDFEYALTTKEGKTTVIKVSGKPVFDANGVFTGYRGAATDVTGQKEAQAQLIQASKLATLGEMASGIAHELNQPLCVVGMAAENSLISMDESTFDTEFVRKKLQSIVSQRDRMAHIVNHMRLFSRRDTTGMELFNPVECVADAVDLVNEQFQTSGIELKADLPAACRNVRGHPLQLEQVVLSLLNNARDAIHGAMKSAGSGHSHPAPMVRISLVDDRRRKAVVISVADTAGGIPDQVLGQIFDPFFTTKKAGRGTGLGLSIGYSIIDAMGGRLEAQNAGDGAEFRISVPAAVDRSGTVDRRSRKKKRKAGTRKRRSDLPRVLVVDDEEMIAEELAEYLQPNGYDVATAGSGLEALELHRSRPADIVITDLFMPEMNGNELIRRLRRSHPDLPIVVVTGHTTFGDEKKSIAGGASVVLKKPIDLPELLGTLGNMVRF
ncbi:MAG: PAS domain S-box protein [Rhodospirillales bacterium]